MSVRIKRVFSWLLGQPPAPSSPQGAGQGSADERLRQHRETASDRDAEHGFDLPAAAASPQQQPRLTLSSRFRVLSRSSAGSRSSDRLASPQGGTRARRFSPFSGRRRSQEAEADLEDYADDFDLAPEVSRGGRDVEIVHLGAAEGSLPEAAEAALAAKPVDDYAADFEDDVNIPRLAVRFGGGGVGGGVASTADGTSDLDGLSDIADEGDFDEDSDADEGVGFDEPPPPLPMEPARIRAGSASSTGPFLIKHNPITKINHITQLSSVSTPLVANNMVYNPKTMKWEGNNEALAEFGPDLRLPEAFRSSGGSENIRFNAEKLRWEGSEEDDDAMAALDDIDDLEDAPAEAETAFQLSPDERTQLVRSQWIHEGLPEALWGETVPRTSGVLHEPADIRGHLFEIRDLAAEFRG